MGKNITLVITGICALGILAFFIWNTRPTDDGVPTLVQTPMPQPSLSPSPSLRLTPATENTPTPTLTPAPTIAVKAIPTPPPLNTSDNDILERLAEQKGGLALVKILTSEEILRKIVRAVYGLSEGRVVREYRPTNSPNGELVAIKTGQQTGDEQELYRISNDNYARYSPYVSLLTHLNSAAMHSLYKFYLPRLEQAYGELGVSGGSFEKTLIIAIDQLLDAPEIEQAYFLTRPSVRYKFADKQLEQLTPAHKLMIRMGRENSEVVKIELTKFKQYLTQQ